MLSNHRHVLRTRRSIRSWAVRWASGSGDDDRRDDIGKRIKSFLAHDPSFSPKKTLFDLDVKHEGLVRNVNAGCIIAEGLESARQGEVISIPEARAEGMVVALEPQSTCILLTSGDVVDVMPDMVLRRTGRQLRAPPLEHCVGAVISPGGKVLARTDTARPATAGEPRGEEEEKTEEEKTEEGAEADDDGAALGPRLFSLRAPALHERVPISRYQHTGVKAIDALFPQGHGSRLAIVGHQGTGKSVMALDMATNFAALHGPNARVVVVRNGSFRRDGLSTLAHFNRFGLADQVVVVDANATHDAGALYLAPIAGTAVASALRARGHDTLLVIDSLSAHAAATDALDARVRRHLRGVTSLYPSLLDVPAQLRGGAALSAVVVVEGPRSEAERLSVLACVDTAVETSQRLAAARVYPAVDGRSVPQTAAPPYQPKPLRYIAAPLRRFLRRCAVVEEGAETARQLGTFDDGELDVANQERDILRALLAQPPAVCHTEEDSFLIFAAGRYGIPHTVSPQDVGRYVVQFVEYVRAYTPEACDVIRKTPAHEPIPEPAAAMLYEAASAFSASWR